MRAHVLTLTLAIACVFTLSGVALAQVLTLPPMPSTGGLPDLFRAGPGTYAPRFTEPAPQRPVPPWHPPAAPSIPRPLAAPPTPGRAAPRPGGTDLFLAGPDTFAPHFSEPSRGPWFYIVLPYVSVAHGTVVYTVAGPRRCISNRLSDCLSVLSRQARSYGTTAHSP